MRILIRKSYDLQVRQAENRRLCGNCYCKDYEGYICINEMGYLLNPNRVSAMFELTLQQNHLRHIRFHDLRHSSASLLLANHVPLKQIQEWLGHSDSARRRTSTRTLMRLPSRTQQKQCCMDWDWKKNEAASKRTCTEA